MQRVTLIVAAALAACSGPPPAPAAHVHVKLRPGGDAAVAALPGAAPLFVRPAAQLAIERAVLVARGEHPPDLSAWRRIPVPAGEPAAVALATRLRADPRVESAFVEPRLELPGLLVRERERPPERACPIETPRYDP